MAIAPPPSGHVHAAGAECRPDVQHRVVRIDVDDPVVPLPGPRVVDGRVVDQVVRADGPDEVQLRRAADAGDLRPVGLRDLDGERADVARGTADQDALAGRRRPTAPRPQRLESEDRRVRQRCGVREGHPVRERLERPLRGADELGECAHPVAEQVGEDGVAEPEPGHVRPDRLDDPRGIEADPRVPRPAQPDEQPDEARLRVDPVEVAAVDGRGTDADEDLVAVGLRDRQVAKLDHLGAAVAIADGGAHQAGRGSRAERSGRTPAKRDRARGGIRRGRRCASGSPRSSPAPGRDPCRSGAGGPP